MAGIYIHIPFCRKRCIYCDFYSTTLAERKEAYVQAVCRELQQRKDYLGNQPIQTIYLGGGTPSLLSPGELKQLFLAISRHYQVDPEAEITLEANPDDLTTHYLQSLKDNTPVNRLSMGVQTFNDKKLALLNRRHTALQAYEAVLRCHDQGFTNLSIDLIYGLPDETPDNWAADLDKAFSLPITHLSAYHLMVEEGTPLWKMLESHKVQEVQEDLSVTFFEQLTRQSRAAGFEHYEISNFAKPGFQSRHNSSYWSGIPYLGCGASAHSYDGKSRQWNVASLETYIKGMESGAVVYEREELSAETRYNEYVMTGLRTSRGFSPAFIQTHFGEPFCQYALRTAKPYLDQGLLERQGENIKLSHRGIFISDGIMADFMKV